MKLTDQQYTPTTGQVREFYAVDEWGVPHDEYRSEFDRWYEAEIAAAEQRGAVKELRSTASLSRACWAANKNLVDPSDPETSYSFDRWLEVRADRLGGDDETH